MGWLASFWPLLLPLHIRSFARATSTLSLSHSLSGTNENTSCDLSPSCVRECVCVCVTPFSCTDTRTNGQNSVGLRDTYIYLDRFCCWFCSSLPSLLKLNAVIFCHLSIVRANTQSTCCTHTHNTTHWHFLGAKYFVRKQFSAQRYMTKILNSRRKIKYGPHADERCQIHEKK